MAAAAEQMRIELHEVTTALAPLQAASRAVVAGVAS